jgi:hypothetical protein
MAMDERLEDVFAVSREEGISNQERIHKSRTQLLYRYIAFHQASCTQGIDWGEMTRGQC